MAFSSARAAARSLLGVDGPWISASPVRSSRLWVRVRNEAEQTKDQREDTPQMRATEARYGSSFQSQRDGFEDHFADRSDDDDFRGSQIP